MINKKIWQPLWRGISTHNTAQLQWNGGIRSALGMAIPLIGGVIFHQLGLAVAMAIGALVAGLAGLSGTSRQKLRMMLSASLWIGLSSFIGSTMGHALLFAIIFTALSGLLTGLMVAVSPQAAQIGMLSTMALIIFTAFPSSPLYAADQMALVIAGGFIQAALMLVFDALSCIHPETLSVAGVLAALSTFSRQRTRRADAQVSAGLIQAEHQLNDSYQQLPYARRLQRFLTVAEKIRPALSSLIAAARQNTPITSESFDAIAQILDQWRRHLLGTNTTAEDRSISDLLVPLEKNVRLLSDEPDAAAALSRIIALVRQEDPTRLSSESLSSPSAFHPIVPFKTWKKSAYDMLMTL
ncbi:MAG: hypothetical protein OWS74_01035, partial [Firmicutes bacterium]|nr:hypothetical protein [Bacillota bacterium]